jgi:putative acetyltransferase
MTKLVRTNSDNADFRELVALLDADLAIRDGDEHSFYAQFNKVDTIWHRQANIQMKIKLPFCD